MIMDKSIKTSVIIPNRKGVKTKNKHLIRWWATHPAPNTDRFTQTEENFKAFDLKIVNFTTVEQPIMLNKIPIPSGNTVEICSSLSPESLYTLCSTLWWKVTKYIYPNTVLWGTLMYFHSTATSCYFILPLLYISVFDFHLWVLHYIYWQLLLLVTLQIKILQKKGRNEISFQPFWYATPFKKSSVQLGPSVMFHVYCC